MRLHRLGMLAVAHVDGFAVIMDKRAAFPMRGVRGSGLLNSSAGSGFIYWALNQTSREPLDQAIIYKF